VWLEKASSHMGNKEGEQKGAQFTFLFAGVPVT
jgi:hypothetical protein